jgi:hypothetical protein
MDMRFGKWNVYSICRTGSMKMVARVLGKYKLDLMGVKEARWEKGGFKQAEDYRFFYGEGNEDYQLGTGFNIYKKIISPVRKVECVSDRVLYIILRGCWCKIIVLKVHTP